MASVYVISVINGSINTIGAYYNRRSLLRGVTAFFDVPVFIFVVALQIRAVIIMKRRVAVISFIRFLFPNHLQGSCRLYMEFFLRLTFFGGYINCTGSALLFLRTNVRSKEYLRKIFGTLFQWYEYVKTYENIFVNFSVNKTIPANAMLKILEKRNQKR